MIEPAALIRAFRRATQGVALLGLLFVLESCASHAIAALPLADVDLNRMYGGWYIIATIPNFVEKKLIEPYDVYSPRPDGGIREDFYVRSTSFDAPCRHFVVHDWVIPGTHNAAWRVQVFWPLNAPFLVAYVDPDYRFAIFGENNRKMGWIYARSPLVDAADYASLLVKLTELGYDASRFKRFLQDPSQFASPGFWTDGVKAPDLPGVRCAPSPDPVAGRLNQ